MSNVPQSNKPDIEETIEKILEARSDEESDEIVEKFVQEGGDPVELIFTMMSQ